MQINLNIGNKNLRNGLSVNDIKEILDRLTEGSDKIIANPETIEKLRSHGLPIKSIPSPTISELFDQRKEHALQIAAHLPPLPEGLSSTIQALYQEIRECIFFGCNGAAITLSGILIEFILKRVTYAKESGGYQNYDPNAWDTFEDMDFSSAINRAKRAGILARLSLFGEKTKEIEGDSRRNHLKIRDQGIEKCLW